MPPAEVWRIIAACLALPVLVGVVSFTTGFVKAILAARRRANLARRVDEFMASEARAERRKRNKKT